jgi:hypothetical protein
VGWWESDMTAKHTQKIRAMDSGVLLTAYVTLVSYVGKCDSLQLAMESNIIKNNI